MSKVFISFKTKQQIYGKRKLVSRLGIRPIIKAAKLETYARFHEILSKKRVQFSDTEIDALGHSADEIVRQLLTLIVGLNKDKTTAIKKSLTGTDIQCAIKCHRFLFSSS